MNALLRVKSLLIDPLPEWKRIEQEASDAVNLLTHYVALLALIPALCGFIGACMIGVIVPEQGTVRVPLFDGLLGAVFGYVASFVVVLLLALIITAVAPAFGGRRDIGSALKLAVYSFTPVWLAGIFMLLPGLNFLLLSGLYGAYLLWVGIPPLMQAPRDKALLYGVVVLVGALALVLLAAAAQRSLFGFPGGI